MCRSRAVRGRRVRRDGGRVWRGGVGRGSGGVGRGCVRDGGVGRGGVRSGRVHHGVGVGRGGRVRGRRVTCRGAGVRCGGVGRRGPSGGLVRGRVLGLRRSGRAPSAGRARRSRAGVEPHAGVMGRRWDRGRRLRRDRYCAGGTGAGQGQSGSDVNDGLAAAPDDVGHTIRAEQCLPFPGVSPPPGRWAAGDWLAGPVPARTGTRAWRVHRGFKADRARPAGELARPRSHDREPKPGTWARLPGGGSDRITRLRKRSHPDMTLVTTTG